MSHYELQQGLKETVTRDWKIFMVNSLNYMNKIIKKYGEGQPVSFTDFFASIIGDTLLKHVSNYYTLYFFQHYIQYTADNLYWPSLLMNNKKKSTKK